MKCDKINKVKLFLTVYHRIYYVIQSEVTCHVSKSSALKTKQKFSIQSLPKFEMMNVGHSLYYIDNSKDNKNIIKDIMCVHSECGLFAIKLRNCNL